MSERDSSIPSLRFRSGGAILGLLALAAVVCGCSKSDAKQQQAAAQPVAVTVVPAQVGPIQRSIEVIGTLYGDEEATVSSKVAGRVVAIYHDVGDRVPRGAALAQLDTTDYTLARTQKEAALGQALAKVGLSKLPQAEFDPQTVPTVQRAKLEAANSESKFNRGRQLHEQTPPRLSDQEFADLQTAWEVARSNYDLEVLTARATLAEAHTRAAELEQAEQMLRDAIVRAPDGATTTSQHATEPTAVPLTPTDFSVVQRTASLGEYVREGTAMFRLIDDDPIKLRAAVPERFLADVRAGQTVRVNVEAYPLETFTGKVTRINPQVDPANRNFMIEVVIPNERQLLRPGGFAQARIETAVDPSVVLIPQSAVVSFAGVHRVFTVKDGKAAELKVELGDRVGDQVEVKSGLTGDETIVIGGANKLSQDAAVAVQPATAAS